MSKYLLMGDIHLSDRAPSSCTDSYNDDIFALLEATVRVAEQETLAGVIWAGDVFHFKAPGRTSHATVKRAIEIANAYPVPLWIVPGNHDLSNDRLASIEEGQPLGTLFASGAAKLLNGWTPDGLVYGVPWLRRFTEETVSDALEAVRDTHKHIDRHVLVATHAPLYPPGCELPFEHYSVHDWSAAMGHRGSCYYGHVHERHGIYNTDGVTYCNPGAISRGSLHEHNLTRTPSCAIWFSESNRFKIVELPARPAGEVFRLQEVAEAKAATADLTDFLTAVGETRLGVVSIEGVLEHVRSLKLGDRFDRLAQELFEGVTE